MAEVKTEMPGLKNSTIIKYSLAGARSFVPYASAVLRWLESRSDFKDLSPDLLDEFARVQIISLVNKLQGSLWYAASGAWGSLFDEIPDFEETLMTAATPPNKVWTPKEGLEWFKDRVPVPASIFHELTAETRASAWTVSNWTSWGFLSDIQTSIGEAIESGQTYSSWFNDVSGKIEAEGFQEVVAGQMYTVFNNAVLNTYSVEKYQGLKAAAELRPFWQYLTVNDGAVRPEHQKLHGKIYRHDDPIWSWLYPPNGYNCRCYIKSLSARQMKDKRLSTKSDRKLVDEGWQYNSALGKEPNDVLKTFAEFNEQRMLGMNEYKKLPSKLNKPIAAPELLPSRKTLKGQGTNDAQATTLYKKRFEDEFGIETSNPTVTVKDSQKNGVDISDNVFDTSHTVDPDLDRYTPMIRSAIENAEEIWLAPQELADGTIKLRRRYMSLFDNGKVMMLEEQNFQNYVPTVLTKTEANKFRNGAILFRRGSSGL